MAFTGTATIKQISDQIVRITGLSLAAGDSGTIGLAGHTGSVPDVVLPDAFNPTPYGYGSATVSLQDCIDVTAQPAELLGSAVPIAVIKTGSTAADFRVTLGNDFEGASPEVEIYVKYHD